MLLLPGERSIRHSHESGELSITFADALHPSVGYTPGGVLHGGTPESKPSEAESKLAALLLEAGVPKLNEIVEQLLEEQRGLRRSLDEARSPAGPRVLIDILFPPFKTTIDDAAYPEPRTIVGPWYD